MMNPAPIAEEAVLKVQATFRPALIAEARVMSERANKPSLEQWRAKAHAHAAMAVAKLFVISAMFAVVQAITVFIKISMSISQLASMMASRFGFPAKELVAITEDLAATFMSKFRFKMTPSLPARETMFISTLIFPLSTAL